MCDRLTRFRLAGEGGSGRDFLLGECSPTGHLRRQHASGRIHTVEGTTTETKAQAGHMVGKGKPDGLQKMIGDSIGQLPDAATAFLTLATAGPDSRPSLLTKLHDVEADADERYVIALRKTAG